MAGTKGRLRLPSTGYAPAVAWRRRSFRRPVQPWDNIASSVTAATVGAHPLPIRELDTHELTAARTILHRAEADLNRFADSGVILRPTERNQMRGRTALEAPCRTVALYVDYGDVHP